MTNSISGGGSAMGGGERRLIRVCAPSAHEGIGDALRRAFAPPPLTTRDREFLQILERC